jgi:hypothetical protein
MSIYFYNKGVLSLIDITTMGDSSKREDESKIGKYDSGLKYAIAILYRNGVDINIKSGGCEYTFKTKIVSDEHTNKKKELLVVIQKKEHETTEHVTAFSPNLGFEWKVWMAVRELYSNCLDENGTIYFEPTDNINEYGNTIIEINGDKLHDIVLNWDSFFIPQNEKPIFESQTVKIYKNTCDSIKLYKQGILIHSDKHSKSKYRYDFSESLDEMRTLNDMDGFKSAVSSQICYCENSDFISLFLSDCKPQTFESKLRFFYRLSDQWVLIINKLFEQNKNYVLYDGLLEAVKEDDRFDIGVKSVKYNSPSYSFSTVEVKVSDEDTKTLSDKVKSICGSKNISLTYPIVESEITRFHAIPDMTKKVIYVTSDFCEDYLWELVKAIFRLESDDDVNYPYKKYCELLT